MTTTNETFVASVHEMQGYGFTQYSGAFPRPETRTGTLSVVDDNNQKRYLVLDHQDGYFYEISTREGPSGTGMQRVWKDKVSITGSGGTDITPKVKFKEDRGEFEKYRVEHLKSNFYLRPYRETNRNASGFDASGYLSDIQFNASIYTDGNPNTITARASDIEIDSSLHYDRKVIGRRVQSEFSATKSGFQLVSRQQDYIVKDEPNTQTNRITTEGNKQENLSSPLLWITRGSTPKLDLVGGTLASGVVTQVTGADGRSESAMQLSGAFTCPSVSSTAAKTLMLWVSGSLSSITVGGTPVSLSTYNTSTPWVLQYATDVAYSGTTVFNTASGASIFDVRMYTGDVSDNLLYYFRDITENQGKNLLPLY